MATIWSLLLHQLGIDRQTLACHGGLGDLAHGAGRLLAAHHRRLGAGPAERKRGA
jgi:hypothetical protein